MRKTMLAGAIAFLLLSANVQALSVGNMQIDSFLGQPLDISIDLNSIAESEFSTLDVSLASRELFDQADIDYPANADNLNIKLGPYENGKAVIKVNTAGAISDPFVHLLLQISWSGGNILREYTALIDPSDYGVEPIVQATAPETSMGVIPLPVSTPAEKPEAELFRSVKKGDTLSAIAALYRPSDVTMQQAWMAFYKLNPEAFIDRNLNQLDKGAQLQIPNDAQMRAMLPSQAIKEVRKLLSPLAPGFSSSATTAASSVYGGPALVVGGKGESAQVTQTASELQNTADSQRENMQLSDLQGYDQLASIVTELGDFAQTIKQEISDSRDRDILFKDELMATRGENKVLNQRIALLEDQLSKMTQLLELQGNALSSLNQNMESNRQNVEQAAAQAAAQGLALAQLNSREPTTSDITSTDEPIVSDVESTSNPAVSSPPVVGGEANANKTYYEQLLDAAISDAPEEDRSNIEQVPDQSSTSIDLQDSNPVTAETQAFAAKSAGSADQATETMPKNASTSLGQLDAPGEAKVTAEPIAPLKIDNQDLAYLDSLNEDDRSQIQNSEQRIAELERELQEKIDAVQAAKLTDAMVATEPAVESNAAEPAVSSAVPVEAAVSSSVESGADADMLSSLMDQAKGFFSSASVMLSGLSADIWRLIGGVGAVIIGIMVILGIRRRRPDTQSTDSIDDAVADYGLFAEGESEQDVGDIAARSMQHQPEEEEDPDGELHGSSLFDLSDESFMASEALSDDSSLFSMDDHDDFDSMNDMDSDQLEQQSTMTQVIDVDPIAEADVYLAYDRKEQAVDVLEQALSSNPNQSMVVIKLLGLYQAGENIEGFTRLFESSAEHIEDDGDWNQIKSMAQEFVPGHEMLADDFDSSIPVLVDKIEQDVVKKPGSNTTNIPDTMETLDLPSIDNADLFLDDGDDELMAQLSDFPDLKLPEKEAGEDSDLDFLEDIKPDAIPELAESDASSKFSLDNANSIDKLELAAELDEAVEEVNQHEPDTALALAKAYIELGEADIAKDFLLDVINAGGDDLKSEAKEMLAELA